jgi:hypothetical protein
VTLNPRGAAAYTNVVPAPYDPWQDPGEEYDIFMTNWAEKTWQLPQMGAKALGLPPTQKHYPNRPVRSGAFITEMVAIRPTGDQSESPGRIGTNASGRGAADWVR